MGSLDRKKPWNPDWLLKNNCYRFKNSNIVFCFMTLTMISIQTLYYLNMLPFGKWEDTVII